MDYATSISILRHIRSAEKGSIVVFEILRNGKRNEGVFFLEDLNESLLKVRRWLGVCGVRFTSELGAKIVALLEALPEPVDGRYVENPGWHGPSFVHGANTYGSEEVVVVDPTLTAKTDKWRWLGNLRDWKQFVSDACATSAVATFTMGLAFAGPILRFTPNTGVGILLSGRSSQGKSTMQAICGSALGGGDDRDFRETFDKSRFGFDRAALRHRDTLLILDETKLLELSGRGRAPLFIRLLFRLSSETPRESVGFETPRENIRGAFLFSSNPSVAEMCRDGGLVHAPEDMVRILEIPVSEEFPVFRFATENVGERRAIVDQYRLKARQTYGLAGHKFLKRLVEDLKSDEAALQNRVSRYMDEGIRLLDLDPAGDPVVHRLATTAAIIFAAGRLAGHYEVLPFDRSIQRKGLSEVWEHVKRKSMRRDPLGSFFSKLSRALPRFVTIRLGPAWLSPSEADAAEGFIIRRGSAEVHVGLSMQGLERLTSQVDVVLKRLEDGGYLQREAGDEKRGKTGKRQPKVTVARDIADSGIKSRPRLYLLRAPFAVLGTA
jgi:hypothetical protein